MVKKILIFCLLIFANLAVNASIDNPDFTLSFPSSFPKVVSHKPESGSWSVTRTHAFYYDAVLLDGSPADFGVLTGEVVTEDATTTEFAYIQGLDINGGYQSMGGVGGLLAVIDKTNTKTYIPSMDQQGSVHTYTDAGTGEVAQRISYDPYGRVVSNTGTVDIPLKFQSKYYDKEIRTYNFGFRLYFPEMHQWGCRDPLEEHDNELNLYAFVKNDPISGIDYLGLEELTNIDQLMEFEEGKYALYLYTQKNFHFRNHFFAGRMIAPMLDEAKRNKGDFLLYSMDKDEFIKEMRTDRDVKTGIKRANKFIHKMRNEIAIAIVLFGVSKGTGFILADINAMSLKVTKNAYGIARRTLNISGRNLNKKVLQRTLATSRKFKDVKINFIAPKHIVVKPNAYSVAYQTKLPKNLYPGMSRGQHFKAANQALLSDMEVSQQLSKMIKDLGISVKAGNRSPAGWTWHHATGEGLMQLAPRPQHAPGSVWQYLFHPDGKGGMAIWGK